MDLKFEYAQDIVIEGKTYALSFVDSVEKADGYLVTRKFMRADGKDVKVFEQFVPKAKADPKSAPAMPPTLVTAPKAIPAAAPAPVAAPAPKAEAPAPEAPKADSEKRGMVSRIFGKKKSKK